MEELKNEFTTDYDVDDSDDENWILKAQGQEVTIPAGEKEEIKTATLQGKEFGFGGNLWKLNNSDAYEEITEVIRSNTKPNNDIIVDAHLWSTSDSEYPVYFWLDNNKLYYWTEATHIYLNKDASYMFQMWKKLTNLNFIKEFDESKTENMSYMFQFCLAVTDFSPIKDWNVSNVNNMTAMFGQTKMTSIDLSKWNTYNVKNMGGMFHNCSNLTTIYASTNFDTSNVTDSGGGMFTDCTALVGGNNTNYDSTKIDKTMAHIDGGTSNPGYFTAK